MIMVGRSRASSRAAARTLAPQVLAGSARHASEVRFDTGSGAGRASKRTLIRATAGRFMIMSELATGFRRSGTHDHGRPVEGEQQWLRSHARSARCLPAPLASSLRTVLAGSARTLAPHGDRHRFWTAM